VREVKWWGDTQSNLRGMPDGVRRQFGDKLRALQHDQLISGAKPWSGCGPAAREYASGGYRMVVTTEFVGVIDVLNVFKKEGPGGRKTRPKHIAIAEKNYKSARAVHDSKPKDQLH
jgi:phage-related protein